MASLAASLAASLPAPKYNSNDSTSTRAGAGRIVSASESQQLVVKRAGPPPYGKRAGWRPRLPEDYGDGGAFPEIPVAQYPLDMGKEGKSSSSKALALQVDAEGKVKYDAIVKQGHDEKRIVHASFKDLIPLRQRADVGEISLARPSAEEVAEQTEKTRLALQKLVSGAEAAQRPKNIKGTNKREPTYVRYTPSSQMGDNSKKNERIIKIIEKQQDPMEPPKFRHKKIPRGPPSPPPPVMHSPPRKLTAADQAAWTIPPPVSNWKNPKGFTVPLDKRLAADGRGLQDTTINDKFAQLSEALYTADMHAREEVRNRAAMQQKLAEKEKVAKSEHLRLMAEKAREAAKRRGRSRSRGSRSGSESRSRSRSDSESDSGSDSEEEAVREREEMRKERAKERERNLRMSRMGTERKMQQLAKEQNRDISERVALGMAKPTQSAEAMYDSRLFNQSSGFNSGFNEDQPYDKPLFAAQEAVQSIYRPRGGQDYDDEEAAAGELDRMQREKRFDVLGKAAKGFKGAELAEERDGPVQFEKAQNDHFNVDGFLQNVKETVQGKKHGLQEKEEKSGKRARVQVDSD